MVGDQVLSVREAAAILGVSPQRVRQMLIARQLAGWRSSAGWLVPRRAVEERAGNAGRGRPAEPRTVWAAIALLAAASAAAERNEMVRPAQVVADRRLRHRVVRMLAELPDPLDDAAPWARLMASRGHVRRLWVHPGVLERLADDASASRGGDVAASLGGEGLAGGTLRLCLYVVGTVGADTLIRRYRMREDPDGQVALVVVPASVPDEFAPAPGEPVPGPAAVADLLDEGDVRARRAAIRRLSYFQGALHAAGWLPSLGSVTALDQGAEEASR